MMKPQQLQEVKVIFDSTSSGLTVDEFVKNFQRILNESSMLDINGRLSTRSRPSAVNLRNHCYHCTE
jgi:hypothetical protein